MEKEEELSFYHNGSHEKQAIVLDKYLSLKPAENRLHFDSKINNE